MTDKEQIKSIIKQYADKGERLFLEASESNESYVESYWDGYKDCADGLLRELEDVQKEPTSVWHDTKEEPPMDSNVVFRYIDAVSSCRYCGQTMKDVIAWAYFKELKEL